MQWKIKTNNYKIIITKKVRLPYYAYYILVRTTE